MLLALASVTDSLVTIATHLIAHLGLAGVALLTLSAGVIGVPGTEAPMLFAGFDVYQGNLTLPGIIIAGVIGDVAGASIAYAIGYFGSQELIERQGSKLHIRPSSIERAQRWFDSYGSAAIFVSRFMPFIRAAFPFAAGVARMPYWKMVVMATLGSIIWIGGLGLLGREVGHQWQTWRHHLEYVDYAGALVLVALIVWLIVRWSKSRQAAPEADSSAAAVDAVRK